MSDLLETSWGVFVVLAWCLPYLLAFGLAAFFLKRYLGIKGLEERLNNIRQEQVRIGVQLDRLVDAHDKPKSSVVEQRPEDGQT